jgi:hypothetical protein
VAQAEIRLTPERHPRVQSLAIAVPPAPDSVLGQALKSLVMLLNDRSGGLPPTLPAASSLDADLLARQLRAASAWAGRCQPGAFRGGDGESSSTVELDGETARLILAVVVDPAQRVLHQANITLAT